MKKLTAKQKVILENKIKLQLEGIEEANKIFNQILEKGYGNLNVLQLKEFKEIIKILKSFHIKEISTMFDNLFEVIQKDDDKTNEILIDIYTCLTKSQEYLENKIKNVEEIEDKELEIFIETSYTFNSLKKDGYTKESNIVLLTTTKDLKTLKKTNEIWLDIDTLNLYYSEGLLKNIQFESNTEKEFFPYLYIKEMAIYPGNNTPRIIFKDYQIKELSNEQIEFIINQVYDDMEFFEKEMKEYLKNPLYKYEYYLIQANVIYDVGDYYIIENKKDQSIKVLKGRNWIEGNVKYIDQEKMGDSAVLIEVKKDNDLNLIINLKALISKEGIFKIN